MEAALRLIRYLINTAHYKIRYSSKGSGLTAYSDANWKNKTPECSTTGYVVYYADAPIAWRSTKQKNYADSSAQSEYMALHACGNEIIAIKNLFTDLHIKYKSSTTVWIDSQSAISIATNPGSSGKSKGIPHRFHKTREWIDRKHIVLQKIAGTSNPADLFTKPLEREATERYCAHLFNR